MFCSGSSVLSHSRAIAVASAALALLSALPTQAHDAPKGWSYPFSCCSGFDCREVSAQAISQKSEGYVIKRTGELVSYADKRLKDSPDGEYHWCSVSGADNTRTICLFVPPPSY